MRKPHGYQMQQASFYQDCYLTAGQYFGIKSSVSIFPSQRKTLRRRYESPGMYSDDDANSDASSACSERSYGSRNGGIPHYLRQTEDVAEVLNHCASSNWSERKEGLLGLQNLLKSQRILRWERAVGYKNTYARNMCFSIWGLVIVIIVFLQSGSKVHTNHF